MSENTSEKGNILKDILATGFPLEIHVKVMLESKGCYVDPDENKLRTIDMMGFKRIELPEEIVVYTDKSKVGQKFFGCLVQNFKSQGDKLW